MDGVFLRPRATTRVISAPKWTICVSMGISRPLKHVLSIWNVTDNTCFNPNFGQFLAQCKPKTGHDQ